MGEKVTNWVGFLINNKSYSISLDLDGELLKVQDIIENEEVAEALKDLFPDFSYVKKKGKPMKE